VPLGMGTAAAGMAWLTALDLQSSYPTDILPPLVVAGLGLGLVMAPAMSLATAGVSAEDAGVASAAVNTMQQVGGSLSTALLNTLTTSAVTDYLDGRNPRDPAVLARAGLEGYSTAYWWSAVFFAAGLIISVHLYRRGAPVQDPDAAPVVHM
jgi:MFS family permease